MKRALLVRRLLLLALSLVFVGTTAHAEIVLWGNGARIMRTDFSTGNTTELLTTQGVVTDLTVDLASGKLYWSDDRIWRSNLDGSQIEHLVTNFGVISIAIDTIRDKLYWTDPSIQHTWRSNLDGTAIEDCSSSFACGQDPKQLQIDSSEGMIYWSQNQAIRRARIDGSDYASIFDMPSGEGAPRDIALDPATSSLYVASHSPDKIRRIDLNDGSVETLLEYGGHVYEPIPQHLAFEPVHRRLYWFEADSDNPGIFPDNLVRYDVETGMIERLFFESHPAPLAVYVPEPRALFSTISAAAWLFLGGASRILRRRSHRAAGR